MSVRTTFEATVEEIRDLGDRVYDVHARYEELAARCKRLGWPAAVAWYERRDELLSEAAAVLGDLVRHIESELGAEPPPAERELLEGQDG